MAREASQAARELGVDIKYFQRHLGVLPHDYTGIDTSRLTFAGFCIQALDLLGALETSSTEAQRADWIEWTYAMQIHPSAKPQSTAANDYDGSHITMTYAALVVLLTLGDDLSRVNKDAIVNFFASCDSPERDMRFVFCACAISFILADWRGVDIPRAFDFIRKSKTYDHGFAQTPGQESHGGSTFCALASLYLMGELRDGATVDFKRTRAWLINRQDSGFHGRVNKPSDTCYAFWVGGSLEILGSHQAFVNVDSLNAFLAETHSSYGGYSKHSDDYPDVMHSYMGFASRALCRDSLVGRLFAPLNISQRAFAHCRQLGLGQSPSGAESQATH
ncbi:geranylgeranyl transferase type-1 subunit beta [Polyrhizophydium stewartii]|uniref:Geranylgeranyl transferase type-1 subunit beta n=1 Tax=Polyrhizophydium stewartii TaxID=2732419 RepID=A0ABR4N9F5_9FUNG